MNDERRPNIFWNYDSLKAILPRSSIKTEEAPKRTFLHTAPAARKIKSFSEEVNSFFGEGEQEASVIALPVKMKIAGYLSFLRKQEEEKRAAGQIGWTSLLRFKRLVWGEFLDHVKTEEDQDIKDLLDGSKAFSELILQAVRSTDGFMFPPRFISSPEEVKEARNFSHARGPFLVTPPCQHLLMLAHEAFSESLRYPEESLEQELFQRRRNLFVQGAHVIAHETFLDPDTVPVKDRIATSRIILKPKWTMYVYFD